MVSYLSKQSKNQVNKRKQLIDWQNVTLFYEDSEGDLNVISEEEDLNDAKKYALEKSQTYLNCNIVDKATFEIIRGEQDGSELNKSTTWDQKNPFRKEKGDKI